MLKRAKSRSLEIKWIRSAWQWWHTEQWGHHPVCLLLYSCSCYSHQVFLLRLTTRVHTQDTVVCYIIWALRSSNVQNHALGMHIENQSGRGWGTYNDRGFRLNSNDTTSMGKMWARWEEKQPATVMMQATPVADGGEGEETAPAGVVTLDSRSQNKQQQQTPMIEQSQGNNW